MSQTKIKNKINKHIPVLLQEVLRVLDPSEGEVYLDLTAGYGGHASEILRNTNANATLVDRDVNAVNELHKKFARDRHVEIVHSDFLKASIDLLHKNSTYDLILADLGVSSPHLDSANRGFSFLNDGPLDMRMDPGQELTAFIVVNNYNESELVNILEKYGQEPKAKQLAKLLVDSRPINSTLELATLAKKVWPGYSRTHPATRLFQAIRIEVNDELGQLELTLNNLVKLLRPGGRIAIITFHSLEDRIVKRFFKQLVGDRYDAELVDLTKKPLIASKDEIVYNPRSRSAKMRAVRKRK